MNWGAVQALRDLYWAWPSWREMKCALRGHDMPEYPAGYNYVLVCRRCRGCAPR